ncbi:hypothetical protein PLICRDRAFT_176966 [Plicaturopsis crispa FD-325 SS-3]|nr:hypothetical protein PLICRDRAFT_176966 [Plicaturopsis crispa FD-325 SS-3]
MPVDLYAILCIEVSATQDEVRKAYKQRVLETHPDKLAPGSSDEDKLRAEAQFRDVHDAFKTLGDAQLRQAYDARRRLPNLSTRPSDYYAARLAELRAQQAEARAEWVRQTEARHQERLAALRERAAAEIRMHERMRARVQEAGVQSAEIESMLNELAELIPGWEERKRAAAERRKTNPQSSGDGRR